MKNSVVFLGTSHGDPSLTRFCSSTLYRFGDCAVLIDAGEPVSALLIRQGFRSCELDGVFLSHIHSDHVSGLGGLVTNITKYPDENRSTDIYFADPAAIEPCSSWMNAMRCNTRPASVNFLPICPETVWEKKGVRVSCIPTDHMKSVNAPSYAFVLEHNGKKIVHSGDLAADFHDFPRVDGEVDLFVCEATHIGNRLEGFIESIAGLPVKKFVFNHIGPLWTDGNEYILEEAMKKVAFEVIVARDGTEIVF